MWIIPECWCSGEQFIRRYALTLKLTTVKHVGGTQRGLNNGRRACAQIHTRARTTQSDQKQRTDRSKHGHPCCHIVHSQKLQ